MIETLLPKAVDSKCPKLVELWGDKTKPRQGWFTFAI